MRAGQDTGLDRNGTNFVKGAAIGTDVALGDLLAEEALAQQFIIGGQLLLGIWLVGGQLGCKLVLDLLDERVALNLRMGLGIEGIGEAFADLSLERGVIVFVDHRRRVDALGLACLGNEFFNAGNDLLDLLLTELDGSQDDFF